MTTETETSTLCPCPSCGILFDRPTPASAATKRRYRGKCRVPAGLCLCACPRCGQVSNWDGRGYRKLTPAQVASLRNRDDFPKFLELLEQYRLEIGCPWG